MDLDQDLDPSLTIIILLSRSMVVSIKSILPEDVSGEGTVSDYSQEEWPRQVLQVHGESIVR